MTRVIGRSGVELDLDESTAASLVKQGVATYAPGEGPQPESEVDSDGTDQAPEVEPPPAEDAPKTAWVEYAVRVHGARFGEAKSLTRDELIERYGQPAADGESAG